MHRDTSGKVRRERLTGEALRAAVVGSSASGRDASHVFVKVGAGEIAGSESLDTIDQPASPTTTTPSRTIAGATTEQLLTHPPRPRKKQRH